MDLTIDNVVKVNNNSYDVYFSSEFTLSDLFYEVSTDGSTWSSPISMSTSSPQNITVSNTINFQIRLSSNYTPPTPPLETGFLMINSNDKFLINDIDSLKYTN